MGSLASVHQAKQGIDEEDAFGILHPVHQAIFLVKQSAAIWQGVPAVELEYILQLERDRAYPFCVISYCAGDFFLSNPIARE